MLLTGKSISPGQAQGITYLLDGEALLSASQSVPPRGTAEEEIARFDAAVDLAHHDLERVERQLVGQLAASDIAIFASHMALIRDRKLVEPIELLIRESGLSAEAAVAQVIGGLYRQFQQHSVSLLQDKATDLLDIGRRLLHCLSSRDHERNDDGPTARTIVVAESLTPSELVGFVHRGVLAIVTASCGVKSHTAILARGFGIPFITGIPHPAAVIPHHVEIFVDGDTGQVVFAPTPEEQPVVDAICRSISQSQITAGPPIAKPITRDGVRVKILLNISDPVEAELVRTWQMDGVGLFRTEFLYMDRNEWPTSEENYAIYRRVSDALGSAEMKVRLVDFGAEKCPAYADIPVSRNPSLGLRGIRLLLLRPDILQPQVQALARLGRERELWVTLPMLDTLDTLERAITEICRFAQVRNRSELPFRLGTMIEVPSAAFMVEELLSRVDSISIGLNDLTQYFLAADRDDETIERYHDPMQPALLRLIKQILDAAERQQKPVTICGELAGDPNLTALLLALGVRRFSVSRSNYRSVVELIRTMSCVELQSLATDVLKMVSGDAVRAYVAERFASVK